MEEQTQQPVPPDPNERRLYPEDQARVDEFLRTGVNSVERKPFRPLILLAVVFIAVTGLSLLSLSLADWADVY